jgi:hypothetical protein
MNYRPGRVTGALILALAGGLLVAGWMLAITVIVVRSMAG